MKANLKNDKGVLKRCKIGFSWTVLFFGFIVPLIRGDARWFSIMLLMYIATIMSAAYIEFVPLLPTDEISLISGNEIPQIVSAFEQFFLICEILCIIVMWVIMPFIYNRIYVHHLLSSGFSVADEFSDRNLKKRRYIL